MSGRWRWGSRVAGAFAAWMLIPALTVRAVDAPPTVRVASGELAGERAARPDGDGDILIFRGVPYAAPPVGPLRFRPPQPAPAWQGVRDATSFGPACPQYPRPDRPGVLKDTSEDCLTLNVWAPAERRATGSYPVMVWIHGGAFRIGSGSWATYDGTTFARDGIVLVSINYRLGELGFFAHPALSAESPDGPLGNYGLMDQIAALAWVRDNISAFGGDPGNVTVFGESAGGASIVHLMVSPMAKGLFHRAISESGGGRQLSRWLHDATPYAPESEETWGLEVARAKGIDGTGPEAAAALRALDPMQLISNLFGPPAERRLGRGASPFVDGVVVPDLSARIFAQGAQHHVPFLLGANSFEASLLGTFGTDPGTVLEGLGEERAEALRVYDPDGKEDAQSLAFDLQGDGMMVSGARFMARAMAKVGAPAYLYHLSYVREALRGKVYGASHGSDIPFVFESFAAPGQSGAGFTESDRAMAELMHGYWVSFAKTGDPNGGDRPLWPRYTPADDALLELGETVAVRKGFDRERLDFQDRRFERATGVALR